MEALTTLLILVGVLCALASKANEKKKKQGKAARPAAPAMQNQMPQREPQEAETAPLAESAPASVQQSFILEGEDPCHQDMLPERPAPAAPEKAVMGQEGRDTCHDYMLKMPAPQPAPLFEQPEPEESPAAQELLRGVILSEVLRRPVPKAYRRKV